MKTDEFNLDQWDENAPFEFGVNLRQLASLALEKTPEKQELESLPNDSEKIGELLEICKKKEEELYQIFVEADHKAQMIKMSKKAKSILKVVNKMFSEKERYTLHYTTVMCKAKTRQSLVYRWLVLDRRNTTSTIDIGDEASRSCTSAAEAILKIELEKLKEEVAEFYDEHGWDLETSIRFDNDSFIEWCKAGFLLKYASDLGYQEYEESLPIDIREIPENERGVISRNAGNQARSAKKAVFCNRYGALVGKQ